MGADLYIESLDRIGDEEGYYRDSYNNTNLLWQYDLSYWTDVGALLDKDNFMSVANIKYFLALIAENELPNPPKLDDGAVVDDDENSLEAWYNYFVEKKQKLMDFLLKAIELNEPIYCSI